jgi:hypothetical protein
MGIMVGGTMRTTNVKVVTTGRIIVFVGVWTMEVWNIIMGRMGVMVPQSLQ